MVSSTVIEFGHRPARFRLDLNAGEDFAQSFQAPNDGSLHGATISWVFEDSTVWLATEGEADNVFSFSKTAALADVLVDGLGFTMFVVNAGKTVLVGRGTVSRG